MDPSLRSRLSAVSRARQPSPAAPAAAAGTRPRGRIPPLSKVLPGREIRTRSGVCWLHERSLGRWGGADPGLAAALELGLAAEAPADLHSDPALAALRGTGLAGGFFLDLETTGLSGMPVFLAGVLATGPAPGRAGGDPAREPPAPPADQDGDTGRLDAAGFHFRLYLARDYREEGPLLESLAAEFEARPTVMTYNGKSYDVPYLRERAARLRVKMPAVRSHLDLLHPARRRWAGRLPDCRLTTLEWHLCGRRRVGDIPGAEIPAVYHRWVQNGDPRPLLPVFRHNMVDLYTLAELTGRVLAEPWPLV